MSPSETPGSTDVFITSTDETGAAVSHPLGTFSRTRKVAAPAPAMNAVTGVTCGAPDGTRTELHAVSGRDEVILLQLKIDPGSSRDPVVRRKVTRIAAPPGAKLKFIGS